MRVLYVAPRYHTNQVPIVRGWLKNGHEVMFVSQFAGKGEDYSDLQPLVAGYSKIFNCLMWIQKWLFHGGKQSEKEEFDIRIKFGFPPLLKTFRQIKEFRPELVILRERSIYNVPIYFYCKKRGAFCILYNQSPLWDMPGRDNGIARRLLISVLPKVRMTPVMGNKEMGKIQMPNTWFVPFVAEPTQDFQRKERKNDELLRLLCVARYEERKRLFLLLEAVQEILDEKKAELIITGEVVDQGQKQYFEKLEEEIRKKGLEKQVSLLKNRTREQVFELYKGADLFILPSTKERASIAQLEAMSCGLPVICSDTNGSACYVESGINGYLFKDDTLSDLKEKIESMVTNREKLFWMGENSYRIVKEKYQFFNYYKKIREIMCEEMSWK